ncbi:uncharacterized protein EDB93DRAFT_1104316 [Suillus bovinus]|uniref:uncharacterized protein n=1 Tax=Suillus bovinus TaxID=48563 RepID=UPI001B8783BC|nr:uncharacterized protein EDB93DRAFT_1104316 [Suillus bovinus]KAG2146546.1 hypothetical protein EDB93DRAFT_1104316 [Suillus bovinus]
MLNKMPMPTAADIARMTYKGAEQLRSEQRPGGDPSKLDFGTVPTCYNCDIPIMDRKCHTANWKTGRFGAQGHKFFCAKNKVHMEKVPQVQALLKQFPWGRIETDGTFAEPIVRAYYHVLGAEGFGYWSIPGGSNAHLKQPRSNTSDPSRALRVDDAKEFEHGYMLLSDKLLTDETGWKLEKRLIPRLVFELGTEPELASKVDIVDWDSWYKWRNIPRESPAALLLHYPLTVYQLLVNVLQVAGPKRNSSESRQALNVHYIGAEVELNMLPLFSELALLLPHTDIKMTFFGIAVHSIVSKAKKNSIVMKAKQNEPIYTYTSPASCGASTLSIFLHGDHENWDPRLPLLLNSKPDAIVGLNAGLTSYPEWQFVILSCHTDNTPFAVTEYAEQSAELQRDAIPQIIARALPRLHSAGMNGLELHNFTRPRKYPIAFNPFQRPGQRNLGSVHLPNVPNGFTMRVVGNDEQEIIHPVSAGIPVPASDLSELLQKTEQFSLNGLD